MYNKQAHQISAVAEPTQGEVKKWPSLSPPLLGRRVLEYKEDAQVAPTSLHRTDDVLFHYSEVQVNAW